MSEYDPEAPIPDVIPRVNFSEGEPIIATEEVHHPSPIPRSVTIIVLLLAAASLVYIAVSKSNEAHDAKAAQDRLAAQVAANKALVLQLQHQQGIIDANEKRLEDLILAVSTAKTPGEVTAAIQRFLKSSARAHEREQQYQARHGGQAQPSSAPCCDTGGSPSPSPRPSASRSPSNSPSPRPSHSPHPSPSPSQVCVATPAGRVCVPRQVVPTIVA